MTKNVLFGVLVIVMLACGGPQPAATDASETADEAGCESFEVPPEGALPLSEILASIEVAGHNAITEVEFEGGVWEIEFVVGGKAYVLDIDPMTGEALSDEPQRVDDD